LQLLISNFQLPVLNSLSRDNGGDSGEAYLAEPFSPQLPGPFAVITSIALAPLAARLSEREMPVTRPVHRLSLDSSATISHARENVKFDSVRAIYLKSLSQQIRFFNSSAESVLSKLSKRLRRTGMLSSVDRMMPQCILPSVMYCS